MIRYYLIRKINHTGGEVEHVPTPNTTWKLQLALCTRGLQTKGNVLTLHPLMELLHKLAAVLFCHTCKFHCFKEVLPSAVVTLKLPLLYANLNCFLFITRVVLITEINQLWGKSKVFQDGFAFPSTLSADVFPEDCVRESGFSVEPGSKQRCVATTEGAGVV